MDAEKSLKAKAYNILYVKISYYACQSDEYHVGKQREEMVCTIWEARNLSMLAEKQYEVYPTSTLLMYLSHFDISEMKQLNIY